MLVDTHCHIHEPSYSLGGDEVLQRAKAAGVEKVICVGTNEQSSREAVEFASTREGAFASVGVHPHDTKEGWGEIAMLLKSRLPPAPSHGHFTGSEARPDGDIPSNEQAEDARPTIVAIGEIGLDYFYTHSPRDIQIRALEEQLDLAIKYNLPVIFHVREAFDDFWPVFDNFRGLRGVLHSFTDTAATMEQALKRGLYIGVNGISTFTKDVQQQAMFRQIPMEKMLLETDAPFLTPTPLRGTINEPAYVRHIMKYHAEVRGLLPEEIAAVTTANASAVFAI